MMRALWRDRVDSFDQNQIEIIQKAIDRAWSVIEHTDDIQPEEDARKLLALCVMNQARSGEENHVSLVNRTIVSFRAQRARIFSETRRRRA